MEIEAIKKEEVTVFGNKDCVNCDKIKTKFDKLGVKYKYEDADYFLSNGNPVDEKVTLRAAIAFSNEEFPVAISGKLNGLGWHTREDLFTMVGERPLVCEGDRCSYEPQSTN